MMKKYLLFIWVYIFYTNTNAQQSASSNNTSSSNDVILLFSPFDKDTIENLNPIFNWAMSSNPNVQIGDGNPIQVLFKYTLVKINPQQNKNEAMMQNQPIYTVYPLQGNMLQYPFSGVPLEKGNRYAWKIEKFLNGALYNQSEIWEFYIKKPEHPKNRYVQLTNVVDANFFNYKAGDTLFFMFQENYANATLTLNVYDNKHNVISNDFFKIDIENPSGIDQKSNNLSSYGQNKYYIVLEESKFRNGSYTIEGVNNKRGKYFLRFKITN